MKECELRLYTNCSLRNKPIGHTGLPLVWRVSVERFGIELKELPSDSGVTARGN